MLWRQPYTHNAYVQFSFCECMVASKACFTLKSEVSTWAQLMRARYSFWSTSDTCLCIHELSLTDRHDGIQFCSDSEPNLSGEEVSSQQMAVFSRVMGSVNLASEEVV